RSSRARRSASAGVKPTFGPCSKRPRVFATEPYLLIDPRVRPPHPVLESAGWRPVEILQYEGIVGPPTANTLRTWNVANSKAFIGDAGGECGEIVDRPHLFRADVDRSCPVRTREPKDTLETIVDVKERSGLLAVAPDLDLAAVLGLGDLAANSGRRLLAPADPHTL